jgi:hypothetical protein
MLKLLADDMSHFLVSIFVDNVLEKSYNTLTNSEKEDTL